MDCARFVNPKQRGARPPSDISSRSGEDGFSILEVSMAMVVLALGALATLGLTLSTAELELQNRETATLTSGTRRVLEDMQATPFSELFNRYNEDTTDDPTSGASSGSTFSVANSSAATNAMNGYGAAGGSPNRLSVNVAFPVDGSGHLSESQDLGLGLPTDLDADGEAGTAGEHKILPSVLTFQYQSRTSTRSFQIPRIFMQRRTRRTAVGGY